MRVHVIEAGRVVANEAFLRATGWSAMFRGRVPIEFPAYVFVLEHDDGLVAIDSGANVQGWPVPRLLRSAIPAPAAIGANDEVGPRMRAAGLDPAAVRTVVLTHLDRDHAGGLHHFPNARVWVHRPDHDFAFSRPGRFRYRPDDWPEGFDPLLYDLEPKPLGPFAQSRALTDDGRIRIVPLPGHAAGQVGVVVDTGQTTLFFIGDHTLSQRWLLEDLAAGRTPNISRMGAPKLGSETTARIRDFVEAQATVLAPSHDSEAPARIERLEPVRIPA